MGNFVSIKWLQDLGITLLPLVYDIEGLPMTLYNTISLKELEIATH